MKRLFVWATLLFCALANVACIGEEPLSPTKKKQPPLQQPKKNPSQSTQQLPEPPVEQKILPTLGIGVSCSGAFACKSNVCKEIPGLGETICTQKCEGNVDCPSGFVCEAHGSSGLCIPSCRKDEDCRAFSSMPSCGIERHCWKAWIPTGYPCAGSGSCLDGECVATGFGKVKVCTKSCDANKGCKSGFICTKGACLPRCESDVSCSPYAALPVCSSKNICQPY